MNIGPVIADKLIKIGITTPEEFFQKDPYELFYKMKTKVDPTLCRCALASIVGAAQQTKRNLVRKEAIMTYETRYPDQKWETERKGC